MAQWSGSAGQLELGVSTHFELSVSVGGTGAHLPLRGTKVVLASQPSGLQRAVEAQASQRRGQRWQRPRTMTCPAPSHLTHLLPFSAMPVTLQDGFVSKSAGSGDDCAQQSLVAGWPNLWRQRTKRTNRTAGLAGGCCSFSCCQSWLLAQARLCTGSGPLLPKCLLGHRKAKLTRPCMPRTW